MKKLIYIIFMSLLLIGCGSKKKAAQKSESKTEQITETNEKTTEKTEKETTTSESQSNKTAEKKQDENFSGEIDDPTKPAVVIKETKDGKEIITYENFKNVNHKKENSESKSNKESVKNAQSKETNEKESVREKMVSAKAFENKKDRQIDRDQGFKFPWWFLLLSLILFVIIVAQRLLK